MKINIISNDTVEVEEENQDVNIQKLGQIPPRSCIDINLGTDGGCVASQLSRDALASVIDKLRHGGCLHVSGPDALEIAKQFYMGDISIQEYSQFNTDVKSQHSLLDMIDLLKGKGLSVDKAYIRGNHFYIKAQRP